MKTPAITFSEDAGIGGLLSILYIAGEWLGGSSKGNGPLFRWHLGPNASLIGVYLEDVVENETIRIAIYDNGAPTGDEITLDVAHVTEVEYL